MRKLRAPYLGSRLAVLSLCLVFVAACSTSTALPTSVATSTELPLQSANPAPTITATNAPVEPQRDDERAVTAIHQIVDQPAGDITFVDRAVLAVSPDAGGHDVLVYEDQNGARYSVDETQYSLVKIEPSGLRFASGPTLSQDVLRQMAMQLALRSGDFAQNEKTLALEEGQKDENYFFTWAGPNGLMLQIGIRADGTLFSYTNTLLYAP